MAVCMRYLVVVIVVKVRTRIDWQAFRDHRGG